MEEVLMLTTSLNDHTSAILRKQNGKYRVLVKFKDGPNKDKEYGSLKPYSSYKIALREFKKTVDYFRKVET